MSRFFRYFSEKYTDVLGVGPLAWNARQPGTMGTGRRARTLITVVPARERVWYNEAHA
jgi:hypothetical protein